jgi:hypothetical protein
LAYMMFWPICVQNSDQMYLDMSLICVVNFEDIFKN